MRPHALPASLALAALLAACGKPLPADKRDYAGTWRAPQMSLSITQDSRVKYERHEDGTSKSLSAPIQEFRGNDIVAGVGPFSTVFVVSAPPHVEDGRTLMTVDGVELAKVR